MYYRTKPRIRREPSILASHAQQLNPSAPPAAANANANVAICLP